MFSNMQTRLGYRVLDNALCAKEYDWQFESFLNRPEVQKAVHVRPGKYAMFAPKMLRKMAADFLSGVGDELSVLLDHYKVLHQLYVVLRNAGHRAAIDQPVWTREMLGHFIRNTSFGHPDNSQLACSDG
ncbi:uncharacterized protein LOC101850159 [Aplysia californica]|uniref:Uncharacterized protein LOC101850159 n=1 Tax=Aplysia californica TaxID=6500 RepID=A0ABM0ZXF4_APLCA|nr:uncharacterized protein LOC101850159 [Aplysia californica]